MQVMREIPIQNPKRIGFSNVRLLARTRARAARALVSADPARADGRSGARAEVRARAGVRARTHDDDSGDRAPAADRYGGVHGPRWAVSATRRVSAARRVRAATRTGNIPAARAGRIPTACRVRPAARAVPSPTGAVFSRAISAASRAVPAPAGLSASGLLAPSKYIHRYTRARALSFPAR
jgi:hypothetical protein